MKRAPSRINPLLLDVNVLLALAWPNHQFHGAAVRRLEESGEVWATCVLTELGFIRLSSNPTVVGVAKTPSEATSLLALLIQDSRHIYFDSMTSPAAPPTSHCFQGILGSKQVTDAYLLSLAEQNGATLLTFDSRLQVLAAAATRVEVLGAR